MNYTTPPIWRYTNDFTYPELNFSIPTVPDVSIGKLPTTPATKTTNPILDNITFALRVFLFITCLVENSIAVFILHKNVRNGRRTFAQFMLINIACVDILSAIIHYSAVFVTFSHGRFVWLVQGLTGDILCKLYNFLVSDFLGKILILSLVALACDAARNSSRKGRKEHSKKFSLICTVLFWLIAAGFSAIYLKTSKVQPNFQSIYECSTDQGTLTTMLNLAAYIFLVIADIILTIVGLVVFIRVRRRRQEMRNRRHKREKERGKYHTKMGRQRVGVEKNVEILDQISSDEVDQDVPDTTSRTRENGADIEGSHQSDTSPINSVEFIEMFSATENVNTPENTDHMSPDEVDQDVRSTTSRETGVGIEGSDQSNTSSINSEVFTEISSATKNVNIPENIEATVIRITKASAVSERCRSHANRKKERKPQPLNDSDEGPSAQEERFKMTRKEAKIMGAISSPFVILSLTQLILIKVCPSCSVYLFYAIQIALEIYAVTKPGIYASIDKEFRKKYKQLSPVACCCFRRIRCHTGQVQTIN